MHVVFIGFLAIVISLVLGLLLQGKHFFIFKYNYGQDASLLTIVKQDFVTMTKCVWMLVIPIPYAISAIFFWYFIFYQPNVHFNGTFEQVATVALIPGFFVLYSLIVAILLSILWTEFKAIRMSVKKYDLEAFMDLRDEKMSPLVHTLVFVLSAFVLGGFMGLRYMNFTSGAICIGSVSYLFALVFSIIVEIDDPCSGIWVIRSIPKEWLRINSKVWRDRRNNTAHQNLLKKIKDMELQFDDKIFETSIMEERRKNKQ